MWKNGVARRLRPFDATTMRAISRLKFWLIHFLVTRHPRFRNVLGKITDAHARLVLSPQVAVPPPAETHDPQQLVARTDALNEAAERYFAHYPFNEYILGKPYSDPLHFPRYLFNLGVLFHWLRAAPGDRVMELGAGTCWVSHFLNLYGCRTVSVDVSPTALELGQELFRRDRRTRWELEPQFLAYDGHRLPAADASCDRIVLHDAFHHIPNPEEILREMARVLRSGGVVAMSEPGRRHSLAADSQADMRETGVLENDVVVEDLDALARRSGFSRVSLIPVSLDSTIEIPAAGLEPFLQGKGFHDYWLRLCQGSLASHYVVLYKGEYVPTTRRPELLRAGIELLEPATDGVLRVAAGSAPRLGCRLRNLGDTRWLAESRSEIGTARLGARFRTPEGTVDWSRASLPRDLDPGEEVVLALELPVISQPGRYLVVFDMVSEFVTWFGQRGSSVVSLELAVQ